MTRLSMPRLGMLAFVLLVLVPAQFVLADFQRFRFESGRVFELSRFGSVIPASCVDHFKDVPRRTDIFEGGWGITVHRLQNGKVVESRPLNEVNGKWIQLHGTGDYHSVGATPLVPDTDFRLEIAKEGAGIAPDQKLADDLKQRLDARKEAREAQQRLDGLHKTTREAFGDRSPYVTWIEQQKAEVEWSWIDGDKSPVKEFQKLQQGVAALLGDHEGWRRAVAAAIAQGHTPEEAVRLVESMGSAVGAKVPNAVAADEVAAIQGLAALRKEADSSAQLLEQQVSGAFPRAHGLRALAHGAAQAVDLRWFDSTVKPEDTQHAFNNIIADMIFSAGWKGAVIVSDPTPGTLEQTLQRIRPLASTLGVTVPDALSEADKAELMVLSKARTSQLTEIDSYRDAFAQVYGARSAQAADVDQVADHVQLGWLGVSEDSNPGERVWASTKSAWSDIDWRVWAMELTLDQGAQQADVLPLLTPLFQRLECDAPQEISAAERDALNRVAELKKSFSDPLDSQIVRTVVDRSVKEDPTVVGSADFVMNQVPRIHAVREQLALASKSVRSVLGEKSKMALMIEPPLLVRQLEFSDDPAEVAEDWATKLGTAIFGEAPARRAIRLSLLEGRVVTKEECEQLTQASKAFGVDSIEPLDEAASKDLSSWIELQKVGNPSRQLDQFAASALLDALERCDSVGDAVKAARYTELSPVEATVKDPQETLTRAFGRIELPPELIDRIRGTTRPDGPVPTPPLVLREGEDVVFVTTPSGKRAIIDKDELSLDRLRAVTGQEELGPIVVHGGSSDLEQRMQEKGIKFTRSDEIVVEDCVNAFTQATEPSGETVVRHFAAKPGEEFTVHMLKLGSQGDSTILTYPSGTKVLVDTGFQKEDVERLKQALGGPPIRLRLVITHRHADHLRGLKYLLEDPNVTLDEVIIGRRDAGDSQLWQEVLEVLKDTKRFIEGPHNSETVAHFMRAGESSTTSVVHTELIDDDLSRLTIKSKEGVDLDVFQRTKAAGENDACLMVQARYKGMSTFLSADATVGVLKQVGTFTEGQGGVFKWPHHIWYPDNAADEAAMVDFLRDGGFHTVLFSNVGANQKPENFQKACGLIRKTLGKSVRILWTDAHGNIKVITLRMHQDGVNSWHCRFGDEHSVERRAA